jgi:hypothetical protein
MQTISREAILRALRDGLEPLEFVHAMWEGGAAAFGRVDAWSDVDVQVDVDDGHAADAFAAAEDALSRLSAIELKYSVPEPAWHGQSQKFYRLHGSSQFLVIDFVVVKHSSSTKFIQREIHGEPVVHFDKSDVIQHVPLDTSTPGRKRTGY